MVLAVSTVPNLALEGVVMFVARMAAWSLLPIHWAGLLFLLIYPRNSRPAPSGTLLSLSLRTLRDSV